MRAFDFCLRLVFFAVAPFLATVVATLFPMMGVLLNCAITLLVFAFAEAARARSGKSRLLRLAMARRLAFEEFYRDNPPRPFLFYVFYPLLLPYVLYRPAMRRELLLYRGLTAGGTAVLLIAAALDYFLHWQPELGLPPFLAVWVIIFVVQSLAIFVFLLPIATTVVTLHGQRRLPALWILLGAAAISVGVAVGFRVHKHGHIVSWVTSHRVALRSRAEPGPARAAQLAALHAVIGNPAELKASTDGEGWVEGDSGDRAEEQLELFYKSDEAYAFSLHALPVSAPEVLVLQCWNPGAGPPVWRAIRRNGQEITDKKDLPPGVLGLKPRKDKRPGTGRRAPILAPPPTRQGASSPSGPGR